METEARVETAEPTVQDDVLCRREGPLLLIATSNGIIHRRAAFVGHEHGNLGGELCQLERA